MRIKRERRCDERRVRKRVSQRKEARWQAGKQAGREQKPRMRMTASGWTERHNNSWQARSVESISMALSMNHCESRNRSVQVRRIEG